ncbi:quinoprotein glucose dehydrogenase [Haloferula luteola]|uniref:Quinoprotein glucose dehydrogenase n=1 Tax=Haloferula luteola TaxID=595692 RepID=A0A840UYF3_9BACT|nr:c-type cytochrome [Haloferula luteola]MBB5350023.1 quinoprotein glucose dehydrogenase [Haloferula luteola]
MLRCAMLVTLAAVARGATTDLTASAEVPGLSLPEGATAQVVATHENQGVTSPTAISQDVQGRWYVAETHRFRFGVEDNRNHEYWLEDDVASRTTADRLKLIEKWLHKFPEGYFTAKTERIRILADPDEQGVFARSEVFAEDFDEPLDGTAAGIFAYDKAVYFACIPKITVLEDSDGDLKSDRRKVLQDGFGVKVSLSGHDLNGFVLGPDGRIWGTVGDRGFAITTREGRRYDFPDQGAVFRFDPDGTHFEVVHTGLRNPKELAFDVHGNPITVDNNADQGDRARVVYVVDGGDSGWRMGHQVLMSFGGPVGVGPDVASAWMTEKSWQTANDDQPAYLVPPVGYLTNGPSGLDYYPGTGFLESEKGRFVVCDYTATPAGSGLWSFRVDEKGAGMSLAEPRKLVWGVTATDVSYAWNGSMMVSDFAGGWTSHEEGRLVKISAQDPYLADAAEEVARAMREGLETVAPDQLAAWLRHPDMRLRIRAQLELTRRPEGPALLVTAAMKGEGLERLHGIWGLGVIMRRGAVADTPVMDDHDFEDLPRTSGVQQFLPVFQKLLADPDAEVRAQAVKVLGEVGGVSDLANFGSLILGDDPRGQFFGTIAAGRSLALGSMTFIWQMLAKHGEEDAYLRHAGAYALSMISTDEQLVTLARRDEVGLRLAAVVALGRKGSPKIEAFLQDADMRVLKEVIRMIHDRNIESARPYLASRASKGIPYNLGEMTWRRLIHNALHLGTEQELRWLAALPAERGLPLSVRREALRVLEIWDAPTPIDGANGSYVPARTEGRVAVASVLGPMVDELTRISPEILEPAIRLIGKLGLDDSDVSAQRWLEIAQDSELPDEAQEAALKRWVLKNPSDRDAKLAEIAAGEDDALALSALAELAEISPEMAAAGVSQGVLSPNPRRKKTAWKMVPDVGGEAMETLIVEGLNRLAEAGGKDPAGLELLDAADQMKSPKVDAALADFSKKLEDGGEPLGTWMVALEGGNAEHGKQLFFNDGRAQCARCHRIGGDFGVTEAGPNLEGVADRGDRRYLLESIVNPQAKVAPGFGVVTVTLKDGSVLGGVLMKEDNDQVEIDMAGERRILDRADLESMSEPISAMPPMGAILNRGEIRDLVEWLAVQHGKREGGH